MSTLTPHRLDDLLDDGVVLTSTLRSAGFGEVDLRSLHRQGTLVRLVRGAWTTNATLAEERFPDEALHMLRTKALLRQMPGRVAASHTSAALLLGLPLWFSSLERVHLSRTKDDHARLRTGAALHQGDFATFTTVDGLPTVAAADAVVGTGQVGGTMARLDFLIAGDSALRRNLTTVDEIEHALAARRRHPGVAALHHLRPLLDPRHESVQETRLGHFMHLYGFASTPQVEVVLEGQVYRADRMLDDYPIVVEMDGLEKYRLDPQGSSHALIREKEREDAFRRAHYLPIRVLTKHLDHPVLLKRRIETAIATAKAQSHLSPGGALAHRAWRPAD